MIGIKIKKEREKKGVTQEVMAFKVRMQFRAYSKIESEAKLPNLEQLVAICEQTGVSSDYYLGIGE
jgi:transcriptional regulator with XRE-family HTH domain